MGVGQAQRVRAVWPKVRGDGAGPASGQLSRPGGEWGGQGTQLPPQPSTPLLGKDFGFYSM